MTSNHRLAALLAAAGLSAAVVCANAAPASTPAFAGDDLGREADAVRELMLKTTRGNKPCPRALAARVDAVVAAPGLEALDGLRRDSALYAVIVCHPLDDPRTLDAAARLDRLSAVKPIVATANLLLLADASRRDDGKAQARAFERIVANDPSQISGKQPWPLYQMLSNLKDDPAAKARTLDLMRGVEWTTEDAHEQVDNGWALQRAELAAEAGDMTLAAAVLDRAREPGVLMTVAQDRRFERLWPEFEAAGRFDWTRIAQADLAHLEEMSRREPGRLDRVVARISALRGLQRYEDARALGADYAERLRRGQRFDDADEQRAWLLNEYAYALADLGDVDAADRLMASAVGDDKISQHVNRAEMLIAAGRPAQALKVLDAADPASGNAYGRMWLDALRVCARAQGGEAGPAAAGLASLNERWRDNPSALTHALLCLGRDDEAAALYIRRFEDPLLRSRVLGALRATPAPPHVTPFVAALHARKAAILARPDVAAAAARIARPLAVPLAGVYWGAL